MQTNDMCAKLLANENLTIVRTNAETAFFDTATRVLSIPNWKDMTPSLEEMLTAHEVGHALYTTHEKWIGLLESSDKKIRNVLKGYFNVIEDARIERLMKHRYPGLRKHFFAGYKDLLTRDFFKLKGRDFNSLIFIDRLNIYFKIGYTAGVKFSQEELELVRKVETITTVDEAFSLAVECYEFSKLQAESRRQSILSDDFGGDERELEEDDYDYDEDESDEDDYDEINFNSYEEDESDEESVEANNKSASSMSDDDLEDELLSETDAALSQNLMDLADTSLVYTYYEFEEKGFRDPIIPFKTVLKETLDAHPMTEQCVIIKKFIDESERVVSYLVKEFEMRKAASAYSRSKISKSGSINVNKLHAYKLTDDIFKRITTTPNGKNHGMIFLLDWSGSMHTNLDSTLKQMINLVMFCRRINIPFEVYAFTSEYYRLKSGYDDANSWVHELATSKEKNILFSDYTFSLLNLFSSKMSSTDFTKMIYRVLGRIQYCKGYSLSSTPLNDSLLHLLKVIPEFKNKNNVEKMSLVLLGDGGGDSLRTNQWIRTSVRENGKLLRRKNFVIDKTTSKTYEHDDTCFSTTSILLKIIKERYDASITGFFLSSSTVRSVKTAYLDNVGTDAPMHLIEQIRHTMRKEGFYSLPNNAYDELFLINDTATKINDLSNLDVDHSASAASIARAMTKSLSGQRHSRIVLERFIGHVA